VHLVSVITVTFDDVRMHGMEYFAVIGCINSVRMFSLLPAYRGAYSRPQLAYFMP